jgi:hypothetical protein
MSANDTLLGIHRVRTLEAGPFTRKQLRLAGAVTLTDDPDEGEIVATLESGKVWHDLLDLDFSEEANQTLSADTTYTIGGLTWTKENSAEDLVAPAVVNGTGLTFCPTVDWDAYQTLRDHPLIRTPLSELLVDDTPLSSDVPLRLCVQGYCASGTSSGYHEIGAALERDDTDHSFVAATRLFSAGSNQGGQCFLRHHASLETIFGTTAILADSDVSCIWLPHGVGGLSTRFGRAEWTGSDWPEIPMLAGWSPTNEYWHRDNWPEVGFARNWSVALYAQTAEQDSGHQWVIQRVRLQAYYGSEE